MQYFSSVGDSQSLEGAFEMTPAVLAARCHPKRKRAHVSYYESSSGDSDADDSSSPTEGLLSRKKRKTTAKAATNKSLPKRKVFPFSSLPAELKNTIYTYALTDPNGVFLASRIKRYRRTVRRVQPSAINTNDHGGYRWRGYRRMQPASGSDANSASIPLPALVPNLLTLNHQIYNEAQPVLYGGNAFTLEDTRALHSFLANIGAGNVAALADVTIKGWGHSKAHKAWNHPAFTLLVGAVNLRRLHLDCRIGWYSSPAKVAMQVYRDAFHWLEAVGSAKGKWDAALDVMEILEDNFMKQYLAVSSQPKLDHGGHMQIFQNELRNLLR